MSEQIRRAARECDLTQAALARLSGVDESALSRFLRGERGLTVAKLDALGAALKLRIVADRKVE